MNVVELSQRLHLLEQQNDRLRQVVNTGRNSQSHRATINGQPYRGNLNLIPQQYRGTVIDFQTKYKKALKEIYDVIQANKSLKQELQKFKTSRSRIDGSMSDMRKQQVYKAYENVLGEKNEMNDRLVQIQNENEHYHMEIGSLQAQMNLLKEENMHLMQQKQALESKLQSGNDGSLKSQQLQQVRQRMREKEHQFHRTIQNYEQHHITLSNQNKKNEERLSDLQQRLIDNDKQWRHRYEAKEIQIKQIKNNVRHQYQEQINMLRKQINSLKLLNTQLMTKLQTIELQGHTDNNMTEYEIQMLNSIKQLRLQMQPLKKQIIELQQQNYFDKEQLQREKTQLQLKLYEHESTIQHYSITIKNQQDKINKLNQTLKKHESNQLNIKKLEEQNKILGGRVIVLESKDIALENRKDNGYRKLQENVLEFQTRVQMLLNQKENLANTKNVTIHQLVTLKAYIAELDQKLKNAFHQNQYATKKYKSYKEKYLNTLKQMKNHQLMHNTLKSKILGYDKLVQRLQSELQKNVNISEMQVIEMTSKTTQEQVQLQTFKKKYQSLKEKLILQQKYNKQELQTIKLNYETKIVDLTIKVEEINSLRQAIQLYKEKNEQLQNLLSRKDNQILDLRMTESKTFPGKSQNQLTSINQNREFILSLQETIRKQQSHIAKVQSELRIQEDTSRKRILILERELHETQGQFNKAKMSTSSTKYSSDKSSQEVLTENKRLRNRISELENEIILTKGRVSEQTSRNSYELEFKASSLEIEKNELNNRLETELSNRKRLQKQINELMVRNNELEAETAQLTIQNNRKVQEITYELNQKLGIIENLEQEIRRAKSQQRKASFQLSPIVNTNVVPMRQDHSLCENKIGRLQRQLQSMRLDNEQLRRRANESAVGSVPFSYEIQSLKHQKQEYRLKIQRLQKQVSANKLTINSMEEEKFESTRVVNSLKQEISSLKLSHQDSLFDKDRIIAQLKTKLQHSEGTQNNYLQIQNQLQYSVGEKDRQIFNLKARLNAAQSDIQRMNDAINKYTRQISNIKFNNQSSHQLYTEQMESLLQEKTKTLKKYQQQINNLHQQISQISTELSSRTQTLIRTQRELTQLQLLQDELNRVTSSLSDRENVISKNRYEISMYEEENQRVKREISNLKEQLQRQRLEMLQKDDEVSSLRLQLSTLNNRLSNQIKGEFIEQLGETQHQVSRLTFQLQSLQANYNNIQEELNETQSRERKAQQQLTYARSQLSRTEQDMSELSQRLLRKEAQITQITNQMTGLKYLQEELAEKNGVINKLRAELSSIRVQMSQLSEQAEYKQSTILRQGNELKSIREEVLNREQLIGMKESQMRNLLIEIQRLKSTLDDNQMTVQQKQNTINKLTTELNKAKQEQTDYEEEIQERQQEWSNIQYEFNQAKSQINLISDQLQAKDITITKLSNQTAFLKQEMTRLNEEIINKNHQINRVSQQVFVQKMQYTNKTSQQVQTLSNELYSLKRQLQSTKHTVQDLQGENRRLKIELQGSRIKLTQQSTPLYIYSQQDMFMLRQENNNKYREIMELQLELNQRNSQINLLHQKTQKLQHLLHQLQEENHYNKQHLEGQIHQFIEHERQLRSKIEFLQSNSSTTQEMTVTSAQEQNTQELKFGLKLYTQQTDRLKKIIQELTEEVTALRLKLTAYTNQQDRINQNLVTMVMTFAQVQALRDRMKTKEEEINSVRRSFIQAISSNQDLNSQYRFQSSNMITNINNQNKEQKIQTFDVLSQNSHSILNYQSQKGQNIVKVEEQFVETYQKQVKQVHQYEIRSDQGSQQVPEQGQDQFAEVRSLNGQNTHQQHGEMQAMKESQHFEPESKQQQSVSQEMHKQQHEVNLPQPVELQQQQSSHAIQQLNQLKEQSIQHEQVIEEHVTFRPNIIQQVLPSTQVHHVHQQYQQISTSQQQRGRNVNIVYQGSQMPTNSSVERQRLAHSQFQSPSGNTYVRITQHQRTMVPTSSGPGIYVPQASNIQPVRQSGASFSSQQQQQRPVSGSFQNQPHNLRY